MVVLGPSSAPAAGDALERELARHLSLHGTVDDERTLRAIVETAFGQAIEARCGDAPAVRGGEDPVAGALPLVGVASDRAGAAQLVRSSFAALAQAGRRDPSLSVEDLADAFLAVVWRGLSSQSR